MSQKASQREATKRAFLSALEGELSSAPRLTVEGVARRAGANKALVYKYFGGLPGLIAAFADSDRFMPGVSELLALCATPLQGLSARGRFAECVKAYVLALSKRPATVQILLRLHGFDAETLAALRAGRARGIADVRAAFGGPDPGLGFNTDLAFNLLVSGACQLLGARRASWLDEAGDVAELALRLTETLQGLIAPTEPSQGTPPP